MSIKLPKKVKVAAFDIEIVSYKGHSARVGEVFGEFSCVEQTISIDTSVSSMQVLDTLIHEVNHAIYWIYSIDDEDEEERIVSIISTAWVQIYRDNPEVLSFITKIIEENP